jgi:hypothetical protein
VVVVVVAAANYLIGYRTRDLPVRSMCLNHYATECSLHSTTEEETAVPTGRKLCGPQCRSTLCALGNVPRSLVEHRTMEKVQKPSHSCQQCSFNNASLLHGTFLLQSNPCKQQDKRVITDKVSSPSYCSPRLSYERRT